jgi:hypothetical protein
VLVREAPPTLFDAGAVFPFVDAPGSTSDPGALPDVLGSGGDGWTRALNRLLALAARGSGAATIVTAVNDALAPTGMEIVDVAVRSRRLAQTLRCRVAAPEEMAVARGTANAAAAGWDRSVVVPVWSRQGVAGLAVLAWVGTDRRSPRPDGEGLDAVAACLSALIERKRLVDENRQAKAQLAMACARGRVWQGAALAAADVLDGADEAALARARYELRAAEREARVLGLAGDPFEASLRRLARWYQSEWGVAVRVRLPDEPTPMPPRTRETLLRIASEALWSLEPGSRSSLVSLRLHAAPPRIELVLRDDGLPLSSRIEPASCCGPYFGLRAIRRWARDIGAEVRWATLSPRGLEFAVATQLGG